MESFDVIVVGTGGVGSAALWQLANRGVRALGLDQFPVGHAHGSSHGQTRIIRQAYFEHVDYVPLLRRSYALWNDVETRCGEKLFHPIGLLEVGPADGVVIPGVMRSVRQHRLPIETLSAEEARRRFPEFVFPDQLSAVFETTAGYLLVERCVETHAKLAQEAGAAWRQQRVVSWTATSNGVTVETEKDRYAAARLVLCGGAWTKALLADVGVPLHVVVKHQYWFGQKSAHHATPDSPTFFFEVPEGYFYGFPRVTDRGVKIARHSGGTIWQRPQSLAEARDEEDETAVGRFVKSYLKTVADAPLSHEACMYTMTPDEHFIVDHHPECDHVVFAGGLSGHGFKFTPVLGEALADLSLQKRTNLPIDFLRLSRFP